MRRWCHGGRGDHRVLTALYIGREVGWQWGWSVLQIRFWVCYNKSILSYHSCDGSRYPWYLVISKLAVVPSSRWLPPGSSSIDGPDIWLVRVPQAHIFDTLPCALHSISSNVDATHAPTNHKWYDPLHIITWPYWFIDLNFTCPSPLLWSIGAKLLLNLPFTHATGPSSQALSWSSPP
jgi:hypothetical protein